MTEYKLPEPEPTYILLDQGPFAGAQVEVSTDIPYGLYKTIYAWRIASDTDDETKGVTAVVEPLLGPFLQYGLLGWNLADRHGPIPATREGCDRVDPSLLLDLITVWSGVIGRAADPLGPNGPEPVPASRLRTTRQPPRSPRSSGTGRSSKRASSQAKPTTSQPSSS